MTVITLTFTGSDEEIVSGIPETVSMTTNIPSTIHYTLDGTDPTTNSPIFTSPVSLPDGETAVVVSALALDGTGEPSATLTQTFAADTTRLNVSRHVSSEGFVLARADTGDNTEDGFDADGNTARFMDVDLETLDVIKKDVGFGGFAEGTSIDVAKPDASSTNSLIDDGFVAFSTPETGELFNPNARTIHQDGRKDNDLQLVMRPFGALHDRYTESGGQRLREPADDATYISGGFVRRFYSQENDIMVSYYFDHNEARYARNIEELPDIPNTRQANMPGPPLVFQWIYRGRHMSI